MEAPEASHQGRDDLDHGSRVNVPWSDLSCRTLTFEALALGHLTSMS